MNPGAICLPSSGSLRGALRSSLFAGRWGLSLGSRFCNVVDSLVMCHQVATDPLRGKVGAWRMAAQQGAWMTVS
jgi:hypothetical protein